MSDERCLTCVLWDDWLERGKCYADLEYHDPDDRCDFWAGSLRAEPVNEPPSPDALLARRVPTQDCEVED